MANGWIQADFAAPDNFVAVERAENMVRQAAVDLIFAYSSAYVLSTADKRALQQKTIKNVEQVMKTARRFRKRNRLHQMI